MASPFTLILGNKNYSSWSLRAWLMLKQTGVKFTEVRVPLSTQDTAQQIRQYSPSGRVPVLMHNELVIWESLAIGEYLAECFPEAELWPAERALRAIARSVSHEMHAGFQELRMHMPMDCRSRLPGWGRNPLVQADIDRILAIWRECRQNFSDRGPFLFGSFTIADAMFAPVVSRFVTYDVPLTGVAESYADAIWKMPLMQEWLRAAEAETEVISY